MKIKQTIGEFFTSKTNLTGLGLIVAGGYGFYSKTMEPTEAIFMVFNGLGFIGVKDALAGLKQ